MTHLGEKMKRLAQGASSFSAQLEKKLDEALAKHESRQHDVNDRAERALATVDAIHDDAEAGMAAIEAELKGLTNQ